MNVKISKLIIIGLMLTGLSGIAYGHAQNNGQGWDVEITITGQADGAVNFNVNPYLLDLSARPGQQPVRFKLTSDTFRFVPEARRAIEVEDDPDNQFSGHSRGAGGKFVTVTNRNSDGRTHHYTIRVQDSEGRLIEIDPLIKNRQ